MLDERSLRKPDFAAESVPITLADGQDWHFPKPWLCLFPVVKEGRVESFAGKTTFGPEFDRLMDAVDQEATYASIVSVAVHLLSLNYALPDAAYSELLRVRSGDEAGTEMLAGVMGVARGLGPKRSSDGGNSPSSE